MRRGGDVGEASGGGTAKVGGCRCLGEMVNGFFQDTFLMLFAITCGDAADHTREEDKRVVVG